MPPIEITLLYSCLLAIFLVILSMRVIYLRGSPFTDFLRKKGDTVSQETLNRAVRGHGNLIEYAPVFLILMLVAELNQLSSAYLHFAGIAFLIGRLMHGILFSFMKQRSMFMRVGGMVLTFLGYGIVVAINLGPVF